MGGGKDRHVIQMVANASLDVIEDVMRKENLMSALLAVSCQDEGTDIILGT